MPNLPAARVGDEIAHTQALKGTKLGFGLGLLAGVVLVGATIATGGAALAVVAAVGGAAAMASAGGLGGKYIGEAEMGPPCGEFVVGSPNVFVNGKAALFTFGSIAACDQHGGPQQLATGAVTVTINVGLAGRETEITACSAKSIAKTSPNVFIGGESAQDPRVDISPEVPQWAVTGLQILGIAGALVALPYAVVAVGVAGIGVTAGLGIVGGIGGTLGGRALGEALGLSESAIRALEVGGGFLGGMAGGGAGGRIVSGRNGWQWGTPRATQDALKNMPLRYQAQYATAKANNWKWPNKGWPPNNGVAGVPRQTTLPAGTKIDRYGPTSGGYTSPSGEPFPSRAMRGEPPSKPPNDYTVKQPLPVEEADIGPWFDQPGGGKQYRLTDPAGIKDRYSVQDAIDDGFLK